MHGHVAGVHTAAHPQTCEKCDKECYSKDSLQKRKVNVNDQLVVSGEPVLEIRKFEYEVTHPHTCEKCDKEFYSKDGLQKHMADVHDQCEEDAEAEFDFDMEEKSTQIVHISPVCVS